MPTYEYKCQACDHAFELFQSIKAASVRKCPQCGKLRVKRLIGIGAGVIFKGSGFYQTDYRSESYRKDAEKDKPVKTGEKTDKKTDKNTDSAKDSTKAKSSKNSD